MKPPLIFLTFLGGALHVFGQTPAPQPALRVLESIEVRRGDRSIIYQQVAPPPPLSIPRAAAAPQPSAAAEPSPSDAARARKMCRGLFLSATVRDDRLSELRWWDRGPEGRAVSNVDFHDLEAITEIETDDTVWMLFTSIRDASREAPMAPREAIVKTQSLDPMQPHYLVLSDASAPAQGEAALVALDALHRFYAENRASLRAARARRQAAEALAEQALKEQALKERPPARKITIINYWSGESRADLPAANGKVEP